MTRRKPNTRYEQYLDAVARLKGPAPTNPFKWLRLNANLTLSDLIEQTGCSKQALIRLEQGTYTDPIERVMNFWVQNASRYNQETNYIDLMRRYEAYQKSIRKRHTRIFGTMPMLSEFERHLDRHPLTTLRSLWTNPETKQVLAGTNGEGMNITECSKLLCVPQSVLDYFSNKIIRQGSVPKPLIDALKDNGYTSAELRVFCDAYQSHRMFMINGVHPDEVRAAKYAQPPVGSYTDREEWLKNLLGEVV